MSVVLQRRVEKFNYKIYIYIYICIYTQWVSKHILYSIGLILAFFFIFILIAKLFPHFFKTLNSVSWHLEWILCAHRHHYMCHTIEFLRGVTVCKWYHVQNSYFKKKKNWVCNKSTLKKTNKARKKTLLKNSWQKKGVKVNKSNTLFRHLWYMSDEDDHHQQMQPDVICKEYLVLADNLKWIVSSSADLTQLYCLKTSSSSREVGGTHHFHSFINTWWQDDYCS